MAMDPVAGRIEVGDVCELAHAVAPWDLRMNQLSRGPFSGSADYARVHDIFLTSERWSNRIAATGATPPGYFALAGTFVKDGFLWCKSRTGETQLAFAPESTEVDFVTPDQEHHWVVLMPRDLVESYVGDELADGLRLPHGIIRADQRWVHLLSCLAHGTILRLQANSAAQADSSLLDACRDELIHAVTNILLDERNSGIDAQDPRRRDVTCRRARFLMDRTKNSISTDTLASRVGVCRRTLELAFSESIGIAPQKYSRLVRLNGMHRLLKHVSPETLTVTDAAQSWGFTELGRAAGYYRELFGETPAQTLRDNRSGNIRRFSDVLS
jgi:AraC family ethanolamine operon transcriptional activator